MVSCFVLVVNRPGVCAVLGFYFAELLNLVCA